MLPKEMAFTSSDIGAIVCERTEMPPYSGAIQEATGLPVFDAVDMVNYVYQMAKPRKG